MGSPKVAITITYFLCFFCCFSFFSCRFWTFCQASRQRGTLKANLPNLGKAFGKKEVANGSNWSENQLCGPAAFRAALFLFLDASAEFNVKKHFLLFIPQPGRKFNHNHERNTKDLICLRFFTIWFPQIVSKEHTQLESPVFRCSGQKNAGQLQKANKHERQTRQSLNSFVVCFLEVFAKFSKRARKSAAGSALYCVILFWTGCY